MKACFKIQNTKVLAIILSLICGITNTAQAETKQEAITKLDKLLVDFKGLEQSAERLDSGRLMVLEKRTESVKKTVNEKDIGNMATLNAYQDLCLTLKYSQSFLASMHTASNDTQVREIADINEQIIKDRGFDDSVVTQLVAGIMSEMHGILMQIKGQGASAKFEKWLYGDDKKQSGFVHELGKALGKAKANGDVPSSYEAGAKVAGELRVKYNELMNINSRSAAYQMVTQLMGLNEFFFEIYTRGGYKEKAVDNQTEKY